MATKTQRLAFEHDVDSFVAELNGGYVRSPPTRGWSSAMVETLRRADIAVVSRQIRGRRGPKIADSMSEF